MAGFRLVLVHGGAPPEDPGPRARPGPIALPPLALDRRSAEVQGAAGYEIQQVLGNLCRARGIGVSIAAIVTRVEVDPDDPAFSRPTRAIGPPYSAAQARRLARERGWTFLGRSTARRRVVVEPRPRRVLEADLIRRLADAGAVTVAAGGGGVPVVERGGGYRGVDAILQEDA